MDDEFAWIRKITPVQTSQPSLVVGIGDDAALYAGDSAFEEVVTMDTMVEDVHFTRTTMTAYDVGYKALAVNLSDLAAMGAVPMYALASVAVPDHWRDELEEVYRGFQSLADRYGVDLIGGDTVTSKGGFVITVTAIGRVPKDRHLLRSEARPGDKVFVTGPLGGSAAGLELLLEHGREYDDAASWEPLIAAHQRPEPCITEGMVIAASGFRAALNDISDGIASEAAEIAAASGVRITLDYERIPRPQMLRNFAVPQQERWILHGGEDFQLLGTAAPETIEKLQQDIALTIIGTVDEGPANVWLVRDGETRMLEEKGYNHFENR
ncbi:MAG TPA: thiamine-phosphate kinase [Bacillales bacterium]|nr:thiamine-phosphate kinase [Bacillales bacterium]